jgi:hypothetical protein
MDRRGNKPSATADRLPVLGRISPSGRTRRSLFIAFFDRVREPLEALPPGVAESSPMVEYRSSNRIGRGPHIVTDTRHMREAPFSEAAAVVCEFRVRLIGDPRR